MAIKYWPSSVGWFARGLAIYLVAWAAGVAAISAVQTWLEYGWGWGVVGITLLALVVLLPFALVAGVIVLVVFRVLLVRVRGTRRRQTAVLISWVAHLGMLAVLSMPWSSTFDPELSSAAWGVLYVAAPATALGLLIRLPGAAS